MNYLKKCLEDKENFIIMTSVGSLAMSDINKSLRDQGAKISIFELGSTANPVIFTSIPIKETQTFTTDSAVPKIEAEIKVGKDTIVLVSDGPDGGKTDFMMESVKISTLAALKSGARSIVVMENMNRSDTSVIYSFKNEEEFVNIMDSISAGLKMDLSGKLEIMRAANTRKPSKVKPD